MNPSWVEVEPQDEAEPMGVFQMIFFMTPEEKAPLYRRCRHENLIIYCQLCKSEAAKEKRE
jgi:hypothetical protein